MLIAEFVKDKPAILFTAQEANDRINLAGFSKKIYQFFGIPSTAGTFTDWGSALTFLAEKGKERQLVLAFDEFPYAAGENRALKSILQDAIDHELRDSGIFLILCGSQVGFMENEVLGYKSPLFGRRTAQIKLEGFDYFEAAQLLEGFGHEDMIKFYACIGGTPHYLAQVNPQETFAENIKRLYFDIAGYLYNEPMMLLQQELREPAVYNSIVAAIAAGASRPKEIANQVGMERTAVSKYLQTLINLQIVRRDLPFGDTSDSSRKGVYRLADFCYHFWYRFVFPNRPEIESGYGALVADDSVWGQELSAYIGQPPFEEICRQYLLRRNRRRELPFLATSFGHWWGNDPKEKCQTDFDVVLANRRHQQILLAECKWKNAYDDVAEIKRLLSKQHLLAEYTDRYYCFFSKIPFSPPAQAMADERLLLITLDMLFEGLV